MTLEPKDAWRVGARMTSAEATKKGMMIWAAACLGSFDLFNGYSFLKFGARCPSPSASIRDLMHSFSTRYRTGTALAMIFVSLFVTPVVVALTFPDGDTLLVDDDALIWRAWLLGLLFVAAFAFAKVFRPD